MRTTAKKAKKELVTEWAIGQPLITQTGLKETNENWLNLRLQN
jgi:hypothetical protein